MKKKHFKTAIASLLLSCTLLTSPLSAMAAVQMNTSTAATTAATTPKPAASGTWKTVKGYHYYYNSKGKMVTGKSMEETALRVNLEAVKELARQLRLRDVGGIVIVDLIDMEKDKNRQAVLAALKDAVKSDRMPVKIEGITRLGLLEMTRKRKGEQLRRVDRRGRKLGRHRPGR